jgi:hypothetical protein
MLDIVIAWGIGLIEIHSISENAPDSVFKCGNMNFKRDPSNGQIQQNMSFYNE